MASETCFNCASYCTVTKINGEWCDHLEKITTADDTCKEWEPNDNLVRSREQKELNYLRAAVKRQYELIESMKNCCNCDFNRNPHKCSGCLGKSPIAYDGWRLKKEKALNG